MRGFGGMLSFGLDGGFGAVRRFLPALRLAHSAANLGSVETIVEFSLVGEPELHGALAGQGPEIWVIDTSTVPSPSRETTPTLAPASVSQTYCVPPSKLVSVRLIPSVPS